MLDVHLLPAAQGDPVWSGEPDSFPTLQWHGDTFDVPPGATLLRAFLAAEPTITARARRLMTRWLRECVIPRGDRDDTHGEPGNPASRQ